MHATIDVRFELSIDDDKTLPLATLAEAVTDQNLESSPSRIAGREPRRRQRRGALW